MIAIVPPRCHQAWWLIWKHLDGRVLVDTARHHDEFGNYESECDEYQGFTEALAAVRTELLLWGVRRAA